MSIAFFDFDKTLLRRNSGTLWLRHEFRHGKVSTFEAMRAFGWLVQYSLGFTDLEKGIRSAIASLQGSLETEMRQRVHAWYEADVKHLYRPGGRDALDRHKTEGHRVVLLTSASNYLSEVVSAELALDDYLCNRFEVDPEGRYTGRSAGTLCYGEGKLELAKAYLQNTDAELSDCWFYTDSMADVSVMEVVGHPVAVNPDPRLARLAKARGWPIEDWG